MRFVPNYIIRACFIILCAPALAQAQHVISFNLRSEADEAERQEEIKSWYEESAGHDFTYYRVNKDISPIAPNGSRYKIFPDESFRVYGQPTLNKHGLYVVRYRSVNIPGCMYSTCMMALPKGYLEEQTWAVVKLWNKIFSAPATTGTETASCKACETRRELPRKPKVISRPKPQPSSAKDLDRSIAWMKNYMHCDDHAELVKQRKNLLEAEKTFGVPASFIACLFHRESRWDMEAVQMNDKTGKMWGSFKGLPQTREASLETERNFLRTSDRAEDRVMVNRYLSGSANKDAVGQLVESNIHYKTDKYSNGIRWLRCGPAASTADKNRISRTSIAFAATYVNRTIDAEVQTLFESGRKREAEALMNTKKSKFLMAAAGYNAGSGHTFDMTPAAAYVSDDTSWISNMYPPPFVANAKKRIEKQCSQSERAAANKKKLQPIKVKVKVKTPKGKPTKYVWQNQRPVAANIKCSKEWLAQKLKPGNFASLARAAEEKRQEVRPYVKWVDICMTADQSKQPPMKGPSLTNPKYLERKNDGCYSSDPLKSCPPKPKPKQKPTAKPKPAAKPTPKPKAKGK